MKVNRIKRLNHRQQTNQNKQQSSKVPQHHPDLTQNQHVEVNVISEQTVLHPDNTPTNKDENPTNRRSPPLKRPSNQNTKVYDAGKIKGHRDYGPENKKAHRPPIKPKKKIYIYMCI